MTVNEALEDLVTANRILADQGVLDAFGHISIRHPDHPDRYVMSRSRGPNLVERDDLIEFTLDGAPVHAETRRFYAERQIHGSIYAARPDVHSVCHNHSPTTIPFGATGTVLRPIFHMGAVGGAKIPLWDIHDEFGDTNLLVTTKAQGDALAHALGASRVVLMRGHGSAVTAATLKMTVFTSIYLQKNAELVMAAHALGGEIHYLSEGETKEAYALLSDTLSQDRAWESWSARVQRSAAS